jgi:tetratricopeptide (TPR) repeat protein
MTKLFDTLFREGTQLLHKGDAQKALPLLERAYQIKPKDIDTGINLSGAYILTRKFKNAIKVLEPLSKIMPDNTMLWINLGAAYLGNPVLAKDGDQRKAISAFQQSLKINPVAPNVAYNIGLIHRDRKEVDEAMIWFKKAIRDNPEDRDAPRLLKQMRLARHKVE